MDDTTQYSPAEFAALAVSDTKKWVSVFRGDGDVPVSELEDLCGEYTNGCTIECVDSEGGYEGGGEHVERTFAILAAGLKDRLAHFQITGYYESNNGTEFDDEITIVFPRKVIVTQYFTTP